MVIGLIDNTYFHRRTHSPVEPTKFCYVMITRLRCSVHTKIKKGTGQILFTKTDLGLLIK